jgi:hypothetical protein
VTFLVISPKNGVALKFYQNNAILFSIVLLCWRFTNPSYMSSSFYLATNTIPYWIVFMNPSHCRGSRCLNHLWNIWFFIWMVLKISISILTKQYGRKNCTNEVNDQCANGVKITIFGCLILFFSFVSFFWGL